MPSNYSDSFIGLPPASGHLTTQQIELAAINETTINETTINDGQKVAFAQLNEQASISGQLRATGTYVSDLGTKAVEGIQSMAGRFGQNIPFLSAGAKTPSFSYLSGSTTSAVSGIIGSAFGGKKGLIPDSAINNLVATKEAKASARVIKEVSGLANPTEDKSHLISLTSIIDGVVVEFLVMPEIIENRTVAYEPVAPAQFPGAFQKYKGTESPQWTLNATLISRTTDEATINLRNMNILRAWTMPFFGENTRQAYPNRIGAPPPVLMLKGLREAMIGPIPVVITSLSWNWPKDVDYIPAESPDRTIKNVPFPTVIQIAIQCVESLSTTEFNQFNLNDYIKGKMIGAYRMPIAADRKENYGNEGRGHQREPAVNAQSNTNFDSRRFPSPRIISEAKSASSSAADAASRVKAPFVSGKGGNFGGGGASGRW